MKIADTIFSSISRDCNKEFDNDFTFAYKNLMLRRRTGIACIYPNLALQFFHIVILTFQTLEFLILLHVRL